MAIQKCYLHLNHAGILRIICENTRLLVWILQGKVREFKVYIFFELSEIF